MQQNNDESLLGTDMVLEAQLRSIEYRVRVAGWLVACFVPVVFLSLGLSQRGIIQFASWMFFVFVVGQFGRVAHLYAFVKVGTTDAGSLLF